MENNYNLIIQKLENKFDLSCYQSGGNVNIMIRSDDIVPVAKSLKLELDFEVLSNITAVDYWPNISPRYHLIYLIRSQAKKLLLVLRVPLDDPDPEIETLESVYNNANWYEREIWDLFGVKFKGHSDLRRLIMPLDWDGHPLRKDYPLGYENVQFTFNKNYVQREKRKASE